MDNTLNNQVWAQVQTDLKKTLSQTTYDTWVAQTFLQDLREVGPDRAIGVVACQTSFHSSTLEKNFYAQIKELLDGLTQKNCELQFRVGSPLSSASLSFSSSSSSFSSSTPSLDGTPQPPSSSSPDEILSSSVRSSSPFHSLPPNSSQPFSSPHSPPSLPPSTTAPPIPSPSSALASPYTHNLESIQKRLQSLAQYSLGTLGTMGESSLVSPPPPTDSVKRNPYSSPNRSSPTLLSDTLFSDNTLRAATVDRARVMAQKSGLRLDYTFETFAVSASNEMAHAAASAVSTQPGTTYNPLFLYGGVGVGKTHLLHAVGNNIITASPEKRVLYCTGEEFMNEIVHAIQTKRTLLFKEKFRSAQVLLLDDVQFIAGKNTVQEEFFHTFNTIVGRQGQIILTSDRPPEEISLLEDRLRSRFQAGLMVDIQQPAFELRIAIVLIKSQAAQLHLPMHLAQNVAAKVDSARKIEGLIQRLISEVKLKHNEVTAELIERIISEEEKKTPPKFLIKPHDLLRVMADFYHCRPLALKGPQRTKALVHARHMAMYIMYLDLHLTLTHIGQLFSNRDHTSVLHGVEKIKTELLSTPQVQAELSRLRLLLAGEKL